MAYVTPGSVHMKGFEQVMSNLNTQIKLIKGRTVQGMIVGSIIVRNDMEKTAPLTPVDLGNLRASWFAVTATKRAEDPMGGKFRNPPKAKGKEAQRASIMKAQHSATIGEYKGKAAMTKEPVLFMGFSAFYAAPVHEMLGANFKRPGAGPKWFEAAVKRNTPKIVAAIAENAKIQ